MPTTIMVGGMAYLQPELLDDQQTVHCHAREHDTPNEQTPDLAVDSGSNQLHKPPKIL